MGSVICVCVRCVKGDGISLLADGDWETMEMDCGKMGRRGLERLKRAAARGRKSAASLSLGCRRYMCLAGYLLQVVAGSEFGAGAPDRKYRVLDSRLLW
jgi:hypothetical protein